MIFFFLAKIQSFSKRSQVVFFPALSSFGEALANSSYKLFYLKFKGYFLLHVPEQGKSGLSFKQLH